MGRAGEIVHLDVGHHQRSELLIRVRLLVFLTRRQPREGGEVIVEAHVARVALADDVARAGLLKHRAWARVDRGQGQHAK